MQDVYFIHIVKEPEDLTTKTRLVSRYLRPSFPIEIKDDIIELLSKAGLIVRYYDPEEKKWMDKSEAGGLSPAPGNRDGSWAHPGLEEFKAEYLGVIFGASAVNS